LTICRADEGGGGLPDAHSRFLPRNKNLKLPVRELRKNATKQENHLWYDFLRNLKPQFLRQFVLNNFILDFYCHKAALAIEVDGSQHYEKEAMEYDTARTEYLNGLGIEVLRFSNSEIDGNFTGVCEKIKIAVKKRLKKSPVT
jgi:very-short-patch-repair endonuclease